MMRWMSFSCLLLVVVTMLLHILIYMLMICIYDMLHGGCDTVASSRGSHVMLT